MVVGNPGTGKTTLCSQFIYDGLDTKTKTEYTFRLVNPKHSFMPMPRGSEWILTNSKD